MSGTWINFAVDVKRIHKELVMTSNSWHYSCPRSVYCRYSWSLSGYLKYTDSTPSLNTRHWCYWYSPFCCVALQEIPVLLSWFVFLARKRLGKIREGKAVSSSCQLANTLEATLKTIVCAICVVPVLKECLIVSRLKLRENQQGATNDNFWKIICTEDDLRSRIFGSFSEKLLACLPLLGFSNFALKRSPRIFGSLFSGRNFRKAKFWSL